MATIDRLWIVSNYNQDPSSVIARLDAPYLICNQGDLVHVPKKYRNDSCFKQGKHSGHNISDYLEYIINNYCNLPDSLGLAKGNIFPRHISENTFIKRQALSGFVPLYSDTTTYRRQNHRVLPFQLVTQQVAPGYLLEISNNWYIKHRKLGKHFPRLNDLFIHFFKRDPPRYIPFVPGGCMIVPASNIQRWPIETYQKLHEAVTYEFFPVEAFHVERSMLYFFSFPQE